jgi:hypothetical protein
MKIRKHYLHVLLVLFVGFCGAVFLAFNHRSLMSETWDPTDNYVAKVTFKTFYSFIPMAPGSSSDKPGYVEIFTKNGESMGEIPVPMLQLAGVYWKQNGADVEMIGEWDFINGDCYYWDESGNKKMYVRGGESN